MRARKRSLTLLVLASALVVGGLSGCVDPVKSQQATLEHLGYSNVQVFEGEKRPYIFSATVNGCTVHLFISQDKEVWTATVDKTANGKSLREQLYPPGAGVFEAVGSEQELRSNQRFTAICP